MLLTCHKLHYFLLPTVWKTEETGTHVLDGSALASGACLAVYHHLLLSSWS